MAIVADRPHWETSEASTSFVGHDQPVVVFDSRCWVVAGPRRRAEDRINHRNRRRITPLPPFPPVYFVRVVSAKDLAGMKFSPTPE